ncbi:MAG: dolichol-phosphate mannosyltransferase [Nitrospirales bacterium]|nr:MAG: dolichol-phosphate mannosyltransferase [Nitrospirales bacterium]
MTVHHVGSECAASETIPLAVSVVVPVTERCDALDEIYRLHADILRRMVPSYEFIFVLDEGFDQSAQPLHDLIAKGEPIRIVPLQRHFGEATVLMVGFQKSQAEVIITLPAYFQTVPEGLHAVLKSLNEGFDLVVTRRYPRQDPWINRFQNRLFHFVMRLLTGVEFHDMSCSLRGIRRPVVREVNLYGDLHRFLPLLAYQRGFRVVERDVAQHPADCHSRMLRPGVYLRRFLDIITVAFLFKFTKKPLRFFGLVGAGLFSGGLSISLVLAVQKLFGLTGLTDRPLLILGALLMVLGVQTASVGLLGEMIVFTHARKMKDYTIKDLLKARI